METNYEVTFLFWLRQRSGRPLSPQEAAHFIRQAADALQPLHNNQSFHGQVTPASFLVRPSTTYSGLPDLQLADFDTLQRLEAHGGGKPIIKTASAMAPEQWPGVTVPASDQYALAVMAYQLLTWRSPFDGDQEHLRYQHLYDQPRPPSQFDTRIPPALDAVIQRALAKNPANRYPSITAFAEAFQQALQPQPQPSPTSQPSLSAYALGVPEAPSQPSTIQPDRPRSSSLKEGLILTLAFLVIMSGIGFGFYTIVNTNRIANARTQNPTATATTDALFATVTREKPLFADSLANNDGHWDINTSCVYSGGTYHAIQSQANIATGCQLKSAIKSNVAIQVDLSLLMGYIAGIFFHLHINGNQLQGIGCFITRQGAFYCISRSNSSKILISQISNPAIRTGSQKNTMLVVAEGSNFRVYLNGTFVGEAADDATSNWFIALAVGTSASDPKGDASFENFKLYLLK